MTKRFLTIALAIMVVLNISVLTVVATDRTPPRASASSSELLVLTAAHFQPYAHLADSLEVTYFFSSGNDLSGNGTFLAPVDLPVGATITEIIYVGRDVASGSTDTCLRLNSGGIVNGNETSKASACTTGAPGDFILTVPVEGGLTVAFGQSYTLSVLLTDTKIHAGAVRYTLP